MNRYLKNLLGSEHFDCPEDQIGYLSEKKTAYIDHVRKLSENATVISCFLGLGALAGVAAGAYSIFAGSNGDFNVHFFDAVCTSSVLGSGCGLVLNEIINEHIVNKAVSKAYKKFDEAASSELGHEVSIPVQIKQEDIDNYERSADMLPGIYNQSNYIGCDGDSMN